MASVVVSSDAVTGPYPGGATLAPRPGKSVLFICEDFTRAWGDNLCAPFYILQDNGVLVNFACLDGGSIPIASAGGPFTQRFLKDDRAMAQSRRCISLTKTRCLNFSGCVYDCVYVPGGDAPESHPVVVDLLQEAAARGRVLAALGPRGVSAFLPLLAASGSPLLAGVRVGGLGVHADAPPSASGGPELNVCAAPAEAEEGAAAEDPLLALAKPPPPLGDSGQGRALAVAAASQGAVPCGGGGGDGGGGRGGAVVDGQLITAAAGAWPPPPGARGGRAAQAGEGAVEVDLGVAILHAVTMEEDRAEGFARWCLLTGYSAPSEEAEA